MNSENIINNRSIEDVVSDRAESGQYDFNHIQHHDRIYLPDDEKECGLIAENKIEYLKSDTNPELILWPSDSDITLLRVKRAGLQFGQYTCQAWDEINDAGVPGDGTHLAESPSMVNLVTSVESGKFYKMACNYESHIDWNCLAGGEYLIALSSWEPTDFSVRDVFYSESVPNSTSARSGVKGKMRSAHVGSNLSAKVSKLFTSCFPRFGNRRDEDSDNSDG